MKTLAQTLYRVQWSGTSLWLQIETEHFDCDDKGGKKTKNMNKILIWYYFGDIAVNLEVLQPAVLLSF